MDADEKQSSWAPWWLLVCLGVSGLFGLGIMFLTTINNGLKVSFYAGFGSFCIVFSVLFVIYAVYRHGKAEGWDF